MDAFTVTRSVKVGVVVSASYVQAGQEVVVLFAGRL